MKPKILFAVPTDGKIKAQTVLHLAHISQHPNVVYNAVVGSPIDQVRNKIVRTMFADDTYTHVLMMDSDMIPPVNAVDKLLEMDTPMACGIYPLLISGSITSSVVEKNEQFPEGHFLTDWADKTGPFEVDAAGTGLVLIKREVFETIPWPWFRFVEGKENNKRVGEDIFFSRKAAKFGYKYMAHPEVVCGHIKEVNLLDIVKAWSKKDDNGQGD